MDNEAVARQRLRRSHAEAIRVTSALLLGLQKLRSEYWSRIDARLQLWLVANSANLSGALSTPGPIAGSWR